MLQVKELNSNKFLIQEEVNQLYTSKEVLDTAFDQKVNRYCIA